MAIALPTSADVRKARAEANKAVSARYDLMRTPVLAWIGATDLAWHRLRELPERLSREQLRRQADEFTERARTTYDEWAEHGEVTVERIRTQPRVERAIRTARNANRRFDQQVETLVDQVHDAGEDLLGRVSSETRSIGEKAARQTQRVAHETAENVTEASAELAGEIREAGDEAARDTRSATRTAAARTAPAKPSNGRRANAGQ